VASLNPALVDVRFCPRCGGKGKVAFPRLLSCDACSYRALWSPEPVAATIPRDDDGRIWLLRRAHHEGAGRWTFPGGFVELGESVEDAATARRGRSAARPARRRLRATCSPAPQAT
jgi:NADH pyrophosphatase NudC (nudix superfamily)